MSAQEDGDNVDRNSYSSRNNRRLKASLSGDFANLVYEIIIQFEQKQIIKHMLGLLNDICQ